MIRLGDKVTDSVTGFTGIVTERRSYLSGPDMFLVTARCIDNNPAQTMINEEERWELSIMELAELKLSCGFEAKK